jgi:hypothetical protein
MDIKANDYQITVTHDELWDLAFNVRRALFDTFKTHWINHQNSWKQNEKQRLHLLQRMFFALGRPDLFEEIETEAEKTFAEFNKKRGSA